MIKLHDNPFGELTVLYADNVPVMAELTINLLFRDWCKLADQPFFLALLEYLADSQIQGSREILEMVRGWASTA